MPPRLPPALNVVGCVEARTTQRTAVSSRAASNAARRSSMSGSDRALRLSGSSSAIVATPVAATS
jgi:hypothetical protein